MLISSIVILVFGYLAGYVFQKIHLPRFIGMMVIGIVIGPYVLDILSDSMLESSILIRQIALVIILTKAGLALDIESLKKIGRPAILLTFVPAVFEMVAVMLLASLLFSIPLLDALLLGTVLAAVSPAVIVPRMLRFIEKDQGGENQVPKLILAGASVDDVFVVVCFYAILGFIQTDTFSILSVGAIPISMIVGILVGFGIGKVFVFIVQKKPLPNFVVFLIIVLITIGMYLFEGVVANIVPFSGLLAILALGITIRSNSEKHSVSLQKNYGYGWIVAEIFLFVLVGAQVDLGYAVLHIGNGLILIVLALVFRMLGVFLSLVYTEFTIKERIFTALATIPKATVQASIGGIPLALGLASGNLILSIAALSILVTAPIGAIVIDKYHPILGLPKEE